MTVADSLPTSLSSSDAAEAGLDLDDRLPLLYEKLHRLARAQLARLAWIPTQLEALELVHEAYLKLARGRQVRWRDDRHIYATGGKAMREVLIDRMRYETAQKRGGTALRDDFEIDDLPARGVEIDCRLEIAEAIRRLGAVEPELARVVVCRLLYGMTNAETATSLAVSERTVQRALRAARDRLRSSHGPRWWRTSRPLSDSPDDDGTLRHR